MQSPHTKGIPTRELHPSCWKLDQLVVSKLYKRLYFVCAAGICQFAIFRWTPQGCSNSQCILQLHRFRNTMAFWAVCVCMHSRTVIHGLPASCLATKIAVVTSRRLHLQDRRPRHDIPTSICIRHCNIVTVQLLTHTFVCVQSRIICVDLRIVCVDRKDRADRHSPLNNRHVCVKNHAFNLPCSPGFVWLLEFRTVIELFSLRVCKTNTGSLFSVLHWDDTPFQHPHP